MALDNNSVVEDELMDLEILGLIENKEDFEDSEYFENNTECSNK